MRGRRRGGGHGRMRRGGDGHCSAVGTAPSPPQLCKASPALWIGIRTPLVYNRCPPLDAGGSVRVGDSADSGEMTPTRRWAGAQGRPILSTYFFHNRHVPSATLHPSIPDPSHLGLAAQPRSFLSPSPPASRVGPGSGRAWAHVRAWLVFLSFLIYGVIPTC
jgi:hypothetical protein